MADPPPPSTAAQQTVSGVAYLLLGAMTIGFYQSAGRKYRSDLYTPKRDAVSHLKKASVNAPLTWDYRLMATLRIVGITGYAIAILLGTISHNFWPLNVDCTFISQLTMIAWQFGKAGMYLTWVLALYTNYKHFPKVAYNVNYLLSVGAAIIIGASVLGTGLVVSLHFSDDQRTDQDGSFPFSCFVHVSDPTMRVTFGLGTIIWDLVMAIGSIRAFTKALQDLHKHYDKDKDEKEFKIARHFGRKYSINVAISAGSTIFWIILALLGTPQFIISILGGIDFFISMVCLALLSPYYTKDQYFGIGPIVDPKSSAEAGGDIDQPEEKELEQIPDASPTVENNEVQQFN